MSKKPTAKTASPTTKMSPYWVPMTREMIRAYPKPPKRPLSDFQMHAQQVRQKCVRKPDTRPQEFFQEYMARACAEWEAKTPAEIAKFTEAARREKEKYETEKAAFIAKYPGAPLRLKYRKTTKVMPDGTTKKVRVGSRLGLLQMPTRNTQPFIYFASQHYSDSKFKGLSVRERAKALGEAFKALPANERAAIDEFCKKERERYAAEFAKFREARNAYLADKIKVVEKPAAKKRGSANAPPAKRTKKAAAEAVVPVKSAKAKAAEKPAAKTPAKSATKSTTNAAEKPAAKAADKAPVKPGRKPAAPKAVATEAPAAKKRAAAADRPPAKRSKKAE